MLGFLFVCRETGVWLFSMRFLRHGPSKRTSLSDSSSVLRCRRPIQAYSASKWTGGHEMVAFTAPDIGFQNFGATGIGPLKTLAAFYPTGALRKALFRIP